MDYLKTVVPSQLIAERGANLVVINPGSANVRMGFASQDVPFNIPHCIAWQIPSANQASHPKMGRVDGLSSQQSKHDSKFTWTDVTDKSIKSSMSIERPVDKDADERTSPDVNDPNSEENNYKEMIFGDDALKIPPDESYCLSYPIRRGHFNISQDYSLHQVLEDLPHYLELDIDRKVAYRFKR
ncbi:hypothetical protein GUJ93_ZPchr0453g6565 [Zizania palustris]|uniref:Uncharacterized protein n=1 Tax=Zizania palustris TaxID=103762 RepID=A0A8J5RCQ2_ZIZPA|nr:hypothetical protein GUJ93_ZPchr0453g6565 [Zizania palustris]